MAWNTFGQENVLLFVFLSPAPSASDPLLGVEHIFSSKVLNVHIHTPFLLKCEPWANHATEAALAQVTVAVKWPRGVHVSRQKRTQHVGG